MPMRNPDAKRFPVYDNIFYIGKPDTTKYGLIPSNIIDDAHIWPHGQNYGVLPSRRVFDALVAANNTNPGPIVLDIEKLPLKVRPARYNNTCKCWRRSLTGPVLTLPARPSGIMVTTL
jgi:hypothetical protein